MAGSLITLDVRTRKEWRQWLAKHHASSPGIWLLRHKQHTGVKSIPYEDLVREALCFGWVDSLIERLDDDRYATKVTPRKPTSKWSDINRRRWNELRAAGLLAAPVQLRLPRRTATRHIRRFLSCRPTLPKHSRRTSESGNTFRRWPRPTGVVSSCGFAPAKRPETRERRIRESIELLSAGKKLGLK